MVMIPKSINLLQLSLNCILLMLKVNVVVVADQRVLIRRCMMYATIICSEMLVKG